jgi:MoaA/NifB/PqqE/SkfB family radical SAM enzyme
MIPTERCLSLLQELKDTGTSAIQYTGGGEPTTHPEFHLILAKAQELGMATALVTNGNLLHDLPSKLLMGLSWIRISMDAGTPETYKKIRHIDSFELVKENIIKLVDAKNRFGYGPIIGIGFVVNPDNWQEVQKAIYLAAELGADNIRISAAFFKDSAEEHMIYMSKANALIEETNVPIKVFNLFGSRIEDLIQKGPAYKKCMYARLVPLIGADQNVYTCCCLAYNSAGLIGSISDCSFVDFWATTAKRFFTMHTTKNCNICMFNNKNAFISYMIDYDSEHVEFI